MGIRDFVLMCCSVNMCYLKVVKCVFFGFVVVVGIDQIFFYSVFSYGVDFVVGIEVILCYF